MSEEEGGMGGREGGRVDLQQMVDNITRLQRLLSLNRHERKMETTRHEQDIKQLARELSLREAEAMRAREEADGAQERAGQLLDECETAQRGREQAELALMSQRKANEQLQVSYDALAAQVALMCQESQTTQALRDQLSAAIKQRLEAERETTSLLEREKMHLLQYEQCEQRLWQAQQECHELQVKVEELQEELRSKEEVVNICREYEQKLTELEDKIDGIQLDVEEKQQEREEQVEGQQQEEGQQQQYVHRVAYSAHTHKQESIRIEERHLRRIVQEQLQESLPSLDDHLRRSEEGKSQQEIVTATTLGDHKQLELLQLLTQNLQRDHGELKQLFRKQQECLTDKHLQLQEVEKSLAQMRYEFLLELSRVTALMNQQILDNRSLREQNLLLQSTLKRMETETLQQGQARGKPQQRTVDHSACLPTMGSFERETCQRSRCRQLQVDNQMLLKYNRQREQIYELIMGSRMDPSTLIAQRLQHSLKYILDHRQQYASLLRHYGLSTEEPLPPRSSPSHLIPQFSVNERRENVSQIQQLEILQSQQEEELLMLQSTAKELSPEVAIASTLQTAVASLSELYRERQRMKPLKYVTQEGDRERWRQDIVGRIQRLKVMAMREGQSKSLLSSLVELQRAIDQFCFT